MLNGLTTGDGDLLRSISGGDEGAFLAFYRRHQGRVFRFALQMSGQVEIAEEVTQDVFMMVMRSSSKYDPKRGSVGAYLYGVARNFVLRRLQQERPYLTTLDDPESEYAGAVADDPGPLSDLTRNERIESLRRAVLTLPPAYREVVVLCDLHELDYAEAAASLECAIGTVRSRLHRARALLAEKMRAEERCAVYER
jgi:RNA polymerase sigma-70 factor, ECF subfamily